MRAGMFSDQERRVFQYHDGSALVWGDPLHVHREMSLVLGGESGKLISDWSYSPPDGQEPDPGLQANALLAERRLVEAVRAVFKMAPFDPQTGQGATDTHCAEALNAWLEYEWAQKKRQENSPTPSAPTPG